MIPTTTIISRSVKPAFFEGLIFIQLFLSFLNGVNKVTGGLFMITFFVHLLPVTNRLSRNLAGPMPECPFAER
jgi:hypothetical protein